MGLVLALALKVWSECQIYVPYWSKNNCFTLLHFHIIPTICFCKTTMNAEPLVRTCFKAKIFRKILSSMKQPTIKNGNKFRVQTENVQEAQHTWMKVWLSSSRLLLHSNVNLGSNTFLPEFLPSYSNQNRNPHPFTGN